MEPMFLLLDDDGQMVHSYHTPWLSEAAAEAERDSPGHPITFDGDVHVALVEEQEARGARLSNPVKRLPVVPSNDEANAAAALAAVGLRRIYAKEVNELTDEQAFEKLQPYLPNSGYYATWERAVENILDYNLKLEKAAGGVSCFDPFRAREHVLPPSIVRGLSFLPAVELRTAQRLMRQAQQEGHPMLQKTAWGAPAWEPIELPEDFSMCVGSTAPCRQSCLVLTGRNDMVRRSKATKQPFPIADAMIHKARKTSAFLKEPAAFLRLLRRSLEHYARCEDPSSLHFVRLNILSDMPWEVIHPELFAGWNRPGFPALSFYDYTKLRGRDTSHVEAPYQLIYSYGGVDKKHGESQPSDAAERYAERVVASGGKVAMVFFFGPTNNRTKYPKGHPKAGKFQSWSRVPSRRDLHFGGYPVYDGDCHDVRPLDPAEARIVGLQYKPPQRQQKRRIKYPKTSRFLVYAESTDIEGLFRVPAVAGQLGAFSFAGE